MQIDSRGRGKKQGLVFAVAIALMPSISVAYRRETLCWIR